MSTRPDIYRYRLTYRPRGGKGEFVMQYAFEISVAMLVDGGEFDLVRFQAVRGAKQIMGDQADALDVVRVEREESPEVWRERRWPLPMPARIDDLVFASDGKLLTNVIPTWPA